MNKISMLAPVAAGSLLGACASMAVNPQLLQQRTAFALGLPLDGFTISDRVDSGIRTDYQVKTTSGQRYQCYVTGTVSVTGRIVSDAVCSKPGQAAVNPLTGR